MAALHRTNIWFFAGSCQLSDDARRIWSRTNLEMHRGTSALLWTSANILLGLLGVLEIQSQWSGEEETPPSATRTVDPCIAGRYNDPSAPL